MSESSYVARRGELQTYFDRTAVEAWKRLTSDAPVGRIRATVRAGRDQMRATLLGWLPGDLRGCRLLDAGCGTGAFAIEAARRGADVIAVDLSPKLIALARERMPENLGGGRITFSVGDMLTRDFGRFDYAVAMDSLIHYTQGDLAASLSRLTDRVGSSIIFTIAPRTPALTLMHSIGRFFPRANRAPAIEPIGRSGLTRLFVHNEGLAGWKIARRQRIASGFYVSEAVEVRPS